MLCKLHNPIDAYGQRYGENLLQFCGQSMIETMDERRWAVEAIGRYVISRLAYTEHNDRDLQMLYGGMVPRIMAATRIGHSL